MKFKWVTFIALAIVTDVVRAVSQQVITKTLRDDLFADYDVDLLPICQTGQNVTLNIDMALRQIMDINEREQVMTNNIWMRLRWTDCRLTWDPASYGNISSVAVLYQNVWIPDITLYDSAAEEVMFPGFENYRATLYNDGTVVYNFPSVVKSVCRVNVRYFPFDTQRCSLQFGSWSHHGGEIDLVNRNPQGSDISSFVANSEWLVDELPVERHVLYYNCCPEPYPDVTYYLVISRRPDFYLLTMIFPCILTSCVAALVFLLPVESGEKVSLEITVLLSLAVFLLLVSESLPPSSDNFPIIGTYFASSMVLVSMSLLQTVVILNMFYRGTTGRRIPGWARVIVFGFLGRIFCSRSSESNRVHDKHREESKKKHLDVELTQMPVKTEHHLENGKLPELEVDIPNGTGPRPRVLRPSLIDPMYDAVSRQTDVIQQIHKIIEAHDNTEKLNSEWRDFANILDKLFFILYALVMCVTSLAFILQCVNGQ